MQVAEVRRNLPLSTARTQLSPLRSKNRAIATVKDLPGQETATGRITPVSYISASGAAKRQQLRADL